MSLPGRRAVVAGLGVGTLWGRALIASVAADDPRIRAADVRQTVSPGRTLAMYLAVPAKARGRHAAVLVVHDDAGLDARARGIARQVALLGYVACAPDFLTRLAGTPADAAAARILTAGLDATETLHDATAALAWLARNPPGERVLSGRVGAVGLGWGAGVVARLAAGPRGAPAAAILVGGPPAVGVPSLDLAATDDPDWERAGPFLKQHLR